MTAVTAALFVLSIFIGLIVGFLIWGLRYRLLDDLEIEVAQKTRRVNEVRSAKALIRQQLKITD